ncbi:sugar transferase [Streptococcus pluranimalium]|uniref:Glucosyltransferase 3 n=1 Tax=Streptococcus pluranimalium TaxID=82348 RepID=A0A345VMR0_9STRE|nr:sugar transferase [Streptococcus pluranimalium]AXJ14012.1 Beta-1,6-galactofuranosyltransferase WbbI [Streptococcus pluranimalium]
MRVYVTNINGQSGTSTAQLGQNMVMDIASKLGYRELGIYCYNMATDTPEELSKRIDGVVASLRHGDVVIFQTPTWNTTAFDERLMAKLKLFKIKIVIFIHDVVPLMFSGNYYLMEQTITYYNKADVLIAPSQAMLDVLKDHGLTVKKTMIQGMWDHLSKIPQLEATFLKEIHFPGSPERFSFVKNWNSELPLHLYAWQQVDLPDRVIHHGFLTDEELQLRMSKGGFGLVWMDDHDKSYQKLYCPFKIGTFLASGIPIVVQRGIANQELIENNGLGLVVDSIEQAVEIIQEMTAEDYKEMVTRVREFSSLVRHGYFTKKLLTDAVVMALCD